MGKRTVFWLEWGWGWTFRLTRKLKWNERGNEFHLLERVIFGMMLHHWTFWVRDRNGGSNFPKLLIKAPMGRFFLKKFVQWVAYGKMWKSMKTSIVSIMTGTALAIPQHLKNNPDGLLKSLLVKTSGIFPKRVFARNSDMMLVSTVWLWRASTTVPLNEQGMAVEGERIWIALEERFTSINHSFDGSILGETSSKGRVSFSCPKYFEVLP